VQSELMPPGSVQEFDFGQSLRKAVELKASDVHFHSGYPPLFRINGRMQRMSETPLTQQQIAGWVLRELSHEELTAFKTNKDCDFVYAIPGVGRFRGSIFMSQTGIKTSFRVIPPAASQLAELGLPPALERLSEFHHGLVLITGPAGSGKSTTLAALVNMINEHHSGHHILTMEDPIEIIHQNKKCLVNQRQVPLHTSSYARAMRAALREDPDIIIIGEMRDAETISLALTAAETGHLVLASMHTTDAVKSISRIVDAFPPEKQSQIRTMISESMQAVFSQLLLPTIDGSGRALAYELLFLNSAIATMIRDKKTFQIPSVMQMGRAQGMCTLSQSIGDLVRAGRVAPEVAKKYVEENVL
jgi:twitching motility protein PilT